MYKSIFHIYSMNNPFDEIIENSNFENDTNIEIWVEQNGRKKNTYVSGWNISNDELKEHLKYIKKKSACNGSIKEIKRNENNIKVLQLQGEHLVFLNNYLIQNGITKELIINRG